MAGVFVLTIQSPIVLMHLLLVNIWDTVGPVVIPTLGATVVTHIVNRIVILIATAIPIVGEVTEREIATHMVEIAETGVIAVVLLLHAVEDIHPITGAVEATREVPLEVVAPQEVEVVTMMSLPPAQQPRVQRTLVAGERTAV